MQMIPQHLFSNDRFRQLLVCLILLVFVVSLFALFSVEQESDITRFLPDNQIKDHLRISQLFDKTNFARSMIVSIRFPDETPVEEMLDLSDRFSQGMRDTGQFLKVRNGKMQAGQEKSIYDFYFNHRFGLFSLNPESEIPVLFSDEELQKAAQKLAQDLAGPMGIAIKRIAVTDPFQMFPKVMNSIQLASSLIAPDMHLGRFCATSHPAMLILAETHASPFDNPAQRELIATLKKQFHTIRSESGLDLSMEYTGINRFSLDAERLIRHDINLAFCLSIVFIILIFRIAYRNLYISLISFLPLISGVIVSIGLSSLIFHKLHGLTIAFGATLIGICIDYPIHIINHYQAFPNSDSEQPRSHRVLFRSLAMCFTTTVIGYVVIAFSGFPGIRQMAFSSMLGLTYAFLFSIILVPLMLTQSIRNALSKNEGKVLIHLRSCRHSLHRYRRAIIIGLTILFLGIIIKLHSIKIHTDIRLLNSQDKKTLEIDQTIKESLKSNAFQTVLVVAADSTESALIENENLHRELVQLKNDNHLDAFFSCVPFIRSHQLQKLNLTVFKDVIREERVDYFFACLEANNFDRVQFEPFRNKVMNLDKLLFSIDDLVNTDIYELLSNFVIQDGPRTFILNLLQTDASPEVLMDLLGNRQGLYAFRQVDLMNEAITSSQSEILRLISFGLVLIAAVLLIYYRNIRKMLAALSPAVFAGLFTVSVLGTFEPSINMMHIVSVLLILCMGVDYGIFLTDTSSLEATDHSAARIATRSVILTALTTLASFGALALTNNGALRSIGVSVFLGILSAAVSAILFNNILFPPVNNEKN